MLPGNHIVVALNSESLEFGYIPNQDIFFSI